ncbi:sugar porter family MFS transporter [Edaphobacter acidisoli]|uniref:sugar porter family MFS transporter n=1 Tax=Edaphobacter acidisoli TaxID=2040573 RepID=UPI0021DF80CD|nr:sugar porter family MFS transporter [Edaphobacter acidisoli]
MLRRLMSGEVNPRYVWFIASIAALGGLLFGYDWVVIGGAKPFYEAFFHLTTAAQEGWAMSCALVGCLIGAIISGVLSEALGRKRSLQIAAAAFVVSSCGTAFASSFTSFVLWRISGGLAIGLASSLSPMYISEIAPAAIRGKLVCLNELTIVLGLLSAQIMNWLIAKPVAANATPSEILASWNGLYAWRWMFGVTAVPAVLFLIGTFVVPESPRWLALRGRTSEASSILTRIGGPSNAAFILDEIAATPRSQGFVHELHTLLEPKLRRVLFLGIALAVLQQWCGINVIFNYAQEIFTAAGYTLSSMLFNIVVTGITMVIFTFIAIATVEDKGRRVLMLTGCAGLLIIYTVLGYLYNIHSHGLPMLVLVIASIACYAMTLAPITWVILAEIFPGHIRGTAMAIATMSLWAACFVLTYTFPALNRSVGTAHTFWIYAVVCALGFLLIRRWLPETKGKTLEQIEASWR